MRVARRHATTGVRELPSSGAPAAGTWAVYARALRDWAEFKETRRCRKAKETGWMAHDADRDVTAGRHFGRALALVQIGGDQQLAAHVPGS
jgi:hypothetical protein